MLSSPFTPLPDVSLVDFIAAVKSGERDFFKVLGVSQDAYTQASFELLMENTDDVLAGVNRVLVRLYGQFFKIFPHGLVKYHDNGDVKFVFYGTFDDVVIIMTTATILFERLGLGIRNEDKGVPFTERQHLLTLARGELSSERDNLMHLWLMEDVSWMLQYKAMPFQEFSLMVTISPPRVKDLSVRRKGTILDLLQCDIPCLMETEAMERKETREVNNLFVDYLFAFPKRAMGVFDCVNIRKWDSNPHFNQGSYTAVTFYAAFGLTADQKIAVMERLIQLYGSDDSGWGDLQLHERDLLEGGKFFTGRRWTFNRQHGLFDSTGENEQQSYEVDVFDFIDETGFNIRIHGYNELIRLFAIE